MIIEGNFSDDLKEKIKEKNVNIDKIELLDLNDDIMKVKTTLLNLSVEHEDYSGVEKYSCEVIQYFKVIRGIYEKLLRKFTLVHTEEQTDYYLLSAFLATFLFKNESMIYFKEHNITFEKCLEELGISQVELYSSDVVMDISTMIGLHNGNIGLKLEDNNVTINDIANMIIDGDKTGNCVIEELVYKVNPLITINGNFKQIVNDYVKAWKTKYINDKMNDIFGNVTKESIDFIVYAWKIYFGINNKYDNSERAKLSLLLAAINSKDVIDEKYKDFLEEIVYEITGVRNSNVYPCEKVLDFEHIEKTYKGIIPVLNEEGLKLENIVKRIYGLEENFDKAFNDFKNDKINETLEKLSQYKSGNYVLNSYRLMKCLEGNFDKLPHAISFEKFSLFVGVFFEDNIVQKLLLNRGICIDIVCQYFGIDKKKLEKYTDIKLEIDLVDYFNKYVFTYIDKLDGVETLFNKHSLYNYSIIKAFVYSGDDKDKLSEELGKFYTEMRQYRNLQSYIDLPCEIINMENVNQIARYGGSLEPLVDEINTTTSRLSQKPIDAEQVALIRGKLNEFARKKNFFELIFKGNDTSIDLNVLDNLKKFLDAQIEVFYNEIGNFTYVKKLIAIYIYKVEQLMNELKNQSLKLDEYIHGNEQSPTYIIEQQERQLKKQLLEVKINDFNTAIIVMMDNYKKMCLLETTHAAYISNMNTSKTTIIPSLYTNLSVSNGLINQRNVSEAVGFINEMLSNMVSLNTDGLVKSLEDVTSNSQLVNSMSDELKLEINRLALDEKNSKPKIKTIQ